MKKVLFLLSAAVWLLASCEGPAGRDGLDGEGMYWFVDDYPVYSNQWQLVNGVDQLGSYYKASISVPQLTRKIFEEGNVFCYMYQRVDGREVQTLLPFTVPYGRMEGHTELLWTETFACDFSPGTITFYVNYSDFYTSNRPETTTFRVVLNY
jgi:hypothetical protein